MNTKSLWVAIVLSVAMFGVAACGDSGSSSGGGGSSSGSTSSGGGATPQINPPKIPMAQSVGAGEGKLSLISWAGYVEDGQNDPNEDWGTPFEKATGCQVTNKIANTSDEMVTLMRTGRYDGVSASGDASLRLIA